jgi:(E)-4-hydroxy-3-methylbut-2-enyl-diphosphate synthase
VVVALEILQALGVRSFNAQRHRLPGLRPHHQHHVPGTGQADRRLPARADAGVAQRYPGVENLKVAVMGCIVNGPGESKHADIGISLPGTGEAPAAPVFIDGEKALTLRGEGIAQEFQHRRDYIERRFGA